MYGNGVRTGTVTAIIALLLKMTHKVQIQAPDAFASDAFFAVVAGTATSTAVGLPIATGTIRAAGPPTPAFVWFFRRTDVSPYPLIPL